MPRKRKVEASCSSSESDGDEVETPKPRSKKAKEAKAGHGDAKRAKIVKASTPQPKAKGKAGSASGSKSDSEQTVPKTLMNKTATEFHSQVFSSQSATQEGQTWNLKISSLNVAGLKAWIKKGGADYILHEKPDIFCLQETKCTEATIPHVKEEGYIFHTFCSSKNGVGHGGVALFSKTKPISVVKGFAHTKSEEDDEFSGRLITAEFEKFYVVNAYVPNSGRGLVTLPKRMRWDPLLREHIKTLDARKPVIVCGDMNVSHQEIDIANPKTNRRNAGFTQEERDSFSVLLKQCDMVDTFRHFYPEKTEAYTFWTYKMNARQRNIGWRLDYFLVSRRFIGHVCDSIMRSEVFGSDHCPLVFFFHV